MIEGKNPGEPQKVLEGLKVFEHRGERICDLKLKSSRGLADIPSGSVRSLKRGSAGE